MSTATSPIQKEAVKSSSSSVESKKPSSSDSKKVFKKLKKAGLTETAVVRAIFDPLRPPPQTDEEYEQDEANRLFVMSNMVNGFIADMGDDAIVRGFIYGLLRFKKNTVHTITYTQYFSKQARFHLFLKMIQALPEKLDDLDPLPVSVQAKTASSGGVAAPSSEQKDKMHRDRRLIIVDSILFMLMGYYTPQLVFLRDPRTHPLVKEMAVSIVEFVVFCLPPLPEYVHQNTLKYFISIVQLIGDYVGGPEEENDKKKNNVQVSASRIQVSSDDDDDE